jgi:hypothetical protein
MKKYLFLEKISKWKIILSIIFFSAIIGLLFQQFISPPNAVLLGTFLLFAGLFFISSEGVEIDFENKYFRSVMSIAGINFGSWKLFNKPEYISIFKKTVTQTIGGKGFQSTATATLREKIIIVNLIYNNGKYSTIYMTKHKNIANEIAEVLKLNLNVEIIDNVEA